ncbi:MAG TPA: AraC family transcriptional regulator [Kofleriaceae bacterium]|nr:AraC family transcriptional regulator [Kofleriaceae bacterium]
MSAHLRRLLRAHAQLREAYAEPLTIHALAETAGLSPYLFVRSFGEAFGKTPHDLLIDIRVEQAKQALARGESVTEACFAVGLTSLGSFSTMFKRRTGSSPAAWQKRARAWVPVVGGIPQLWIPACFASFFGPSNFGEAPVVAAR